MDAKGRYINVVYTRALEHKGKAQEAEGPHDDGAFANDGADDGAPSSASSSTSSTSGGEVAASGGSGGEGGEEAGGASGRGREGTAEEVLLRKIGR